MKVFEFESVTESYSELLKYVLENGEEVSPRGMLTKEITPATIVINNPRKRVIDNKVRKLNYGFMAGELLWILQGRNDLSITHYNKQWSNYSDDGSILNGAYGQRIFRWDGHYNSQINQFLKVYEKLKKDPDSRQGTIVLFDPSKDFEDTKDVPCTNLMRFSIRNGKLNMMVTMRSNDIIYGTPYDIYNFTMLQEIMAGLLGVEVGKYTHVADSLHLYEMHFELAEKIVNSDQDSVYDSFNVQDARLNKEKLDKTLDEVFKVENLTRENIDIVSIEDIQKSLNNIQNEYWRSIAALTAVYNFKKGKRSKEELAILKKYITNEFSKLESVQNW